MGLRRWDREGGPGRQWPSELQQSANVRYGLAMRARHQRPIHLGEGEVELLLGLRLLKMEGRPGQ